MVVRKVAYYIVAADMAVAAVAGHMVVVDMVAAALVGRILGHMVVGCVPSVAAVVAHTLADLDRSS